MVKITNGKEIITVTQNAYKEVFRRAGYKLYSEVEQEAHEEQWQEVPKAQPTKPISQWTRKELVEYIVSHGGKADGKTDELRAMVREHMEENG